MFVPRTIFPEYRTTLAHFKGHQKKALDVFDKLRPQIHMIIHLKDARAPNATAAVPRSVLKSTPVLTVFSNKDRSDFIVNKEELCLDARGSMTPLFTKLKEFHQSLWPPPPLGLRLLVVGVPNIGKSTLINSMRAAKLSRRKVARTGLQAGTTRATSEVVKVYDEPDMYVYDTPGVIVPQVESVDYLLQLYLLGSVMARTDSLSGIDPVLAADYLLFIMNLRGPNRYMKPLMMTEPTNSIEDVLQVIAKKYKMMQKNKEGQMVIEKRGAATQLIHLYRKGVFGKLVLDKDLALKKYERRLKRE